MRELNSFKSGVDRYSSLCASCKHHSKKEEFYNSSLEVFTKENGLAFTRKETSKEFSGILNPQTSMVLSLASVLNSNAILKILPRHRNKVIDKLNGLLLNNEFSIQNYEILSQRLNEIEPVSGVTIHLGELERRKVPEKVVNRIKDVIIQTYSGNSNARNEYTAWSRKKSNFSKIEEIKSQPCAFCGGKSTSIDHKVPLVAGGDPTDITNLLPSCKECNQIKGTMSYDEFIKLTKTFLKEPYKKTKELTSEIKTMSREVEQLKEQLALKLKAIELKAHEKAILVNKQASIVSNLEEINSLMD